MRGHSKEVKRRKAAILIYYGTVWNLWKEMDRRIFQAVTSPTDRIVALDGSSSCGS
ncbi:hypothetical protein HU200_043416 [Digitaria exilis]|uniref:Uncharacterized protein n=1 Tax=Digitaria exilis TaxID=1010633 RepID=A0A835B473_9POAL|nr:hypothetical protein HU200_043416 [Digitaria exilis]